MLFAVQLLLTILSVFNNLSVVVCVVGRSVGQTEVTSKQDVKQIIP
jgi:hypothetical protein